MNNVRAILCYFFGSQMYINYTRQIAKCDKVNQNRDSKPYVIQSVFLSTLPQIQYKTLAEIWLVYKDRVLCLNF